MNYIISGKNIILTEALKEYARSKVGKLEKFFEPSTEAHITLGVQKERHLVEVTIMFKGIVFRAEEENDSMYAAIDKVSDVLERQIRKNRTRLEKKMYEDALKYKQIFEEDKKENILEEKEYRIKRIKKFEAKPMDVEEAILQMNLTSHDFFAFVNIETNQVNIVYKRNSGDYGILEPDI